MKEKLSTKHKRAYKKATELGYMNILDAEDNGTEEDKQAVRKAFDGKSEAMEPNPMELTLSTVLTARQTVYIGAGINASFTKGKRYSIGEINRVSFLVADDNRKLVYIPHDLLKLFTAEIPKKEQ